MGSRKHRRNIQLKTHVLPLKENASRGTVVYSVGALKGLGLAVYVTTIRENGRSEQDGGDKGGFEEHNEREGPGWSTDGEKNVR